MLRWLDGFEHYATANLLEQYSGRLQVAATITVAAAGRYTTNCLRVAVTSLTTGQGGYVTRTLDAQAAWVVGFAFRTSVLPAGNTFILLALWDAGSVQVDLRLDSSGRLSVTRAGTVPTGGGPSVSGLAINTWYFVEFKCTISASIGANAWQVFVNGSPVLTVATGQSSKATANATADTVVLGPLASGSTSATGNLDFDDLYILDGQAGLSAPLGDSKVLTLLPTGDGATSAWTNTAGNHTANYTYVNTAIPSPTTPYVQDDTVGHVDTYVMADLPGGVATVKGAMVSLYALATDTGPRSVADVVRDGGGDHAGAGQALTGTRTFLQFNRETDPSGSAWTPTTLNAVEVGQKVSA